MIAGYQKIPLMVNILQLKIFMVQNSIKVSKSKL